MNALRRPKSLRLLGALTLFSGTACASTTSVAANRPAIQTQRVLEMTPIIISPFTDQELAREFERGRSLLLRDKYAEAVPIFENVVRLAPSGPTAAPSLFNGGLAREASGDREGALERYAELLK